MVGHGGFGQVWKATDTELQRVVAVKIPRPERMDDVNGALFLREAQAAARLRHPNIVSVHEIGREEGTFYIVTDFVDGASLADRLTAGRMQTGDAVELTIAIADALQHAHDHGVIHRDLKPSNILVDQGGRPYVADFGLAKREDVERTISADRQIMGTPAYMATGTGAGGIGRSSLRTFIRWA